MLSEKDEQQELLEAVCERFRAGEGVACRFFSMNNTYLFVGDHKYWLMNDWDALEPGATTSSTALSSIGTGGTSSSSPETRAGPRIIRLTLPIKVKVSWCRISAASQTLRSGGVISYRYSS